MTYQIEVGKRHFPRGTAPDDVKLGYVMTPCIMEKAILEQIPAFRLNHYMGIGDEIIDRWHHDRIAGRVAGWGRQVAEELGAKIHADPAYTQIFELDFNP